MTGAEYLVQSLIAHGTDTVFGYPGATVLSVYDALYRHRGEIRHVRAAHEQGAAHAADGYARASGKPGVCLATSGPGATNLVTGIANAFMDSVPTIFITGNVELPLIGTDSFQEVDITGITLSVTKHSFMVRSFEELRRALEQAYVICTEGRRGPVLIDIPKNFLEGKMPGVLPDVQPVCKSAFSFENPESAFLNAAELLKTAEKPLILIGGGVRMSGASDPVRKLARKLNAPVCSSLMAVGEIPYTDPLYAGALGKRMAPAARRAFAEADLILAIGTRFSNRMLQDETLSDRKIIHIDADRAEINKIVTPDCYLVGDARDVLEKLLPYVTERAPRQWTADIIAQRSRETYRNVRPGRVDPTAVFRAMHTVLGADARIVTDVGQHQMLTADYYPFEKSGRFITSGGLGAMGFGLGAAIGAALADPEVPVALITGDGSFGMNCTELVTVAREKIPLVIVLLNNRMLGMVHNIQQERYGKRYAETGMRGGPDYVRLAKAFGIDAYKIRSDAEFAEILTQYRQEKKPVLFDVRI